MATKNLGKKVSYELEWKYEKRLATQHLGIYKYSTSAKALTELIANGFDAGADVIDVITKENDLGTIDSILIRDNGCGINPDVLKERFTSIGVEPDGQRIQFAKFGIGRFAVHRIGEKSHWKTISKGLDGKYHLVEFELDSDEQKNFKVTETILDEIAGTGTSIEIFNIRDKGKDTLTTSRLEGVLLAEFCSFLLANPHKQIKLGDEVLNVENIVRSRESEPIPSSAKIPENVKIDHLLLQKPVDKSRLPSQVIFSAKGRMVQGAQPDDTPPPNYLGIVECDYLNSIVSSNRQELIEMDDTFANLKAVAMAKVSDFGKRYRAESAKRFIEKARQEDSYPFRDIPQDSTMMVRREIYDVFLEKVHEHINIDSMTKKQKGVIFRLLDRAMDDDNLMDVLNAVAKLSSDDIEKFRKVLEHTALTSIIKLSSEVTNRIVFLDVLHDLVYGDYAKKLKERCQLHKILEPHCWLFGPQFHLATSDESFRKIVPKHREKAGLPQIDHDSISKIDHVDRIPDLFLYAIKEYPNSSRNNHLIIEIKAPKVSIGSKEIDQIKTYGNIIRKAPEFDKTTTRWDLFLISADISENVEDYRRQKDRPVGWLMEWDDMAIWTFTWSEIIARAKTEMQLVREHLKLKSDQLSVSQFLRDNFPDVLGSLQEVISK